MRAVQAWRAKNPGNELVWPDHVRMVEWLLDQPGVAAILRGEAVAVPKEPTMEMLYAAAEKDNQAYCGGSQHGADDETIYAAMLAASPYAVKP